MPSTWIAIVLSACTVCGALAVIEFDGVLANLVKGLYAFGAEVPLADPTTFATALGKRRRQINGTETPSASASRRAGSRRPDRPDAFGGVAAVRDARRLPGAGGGLGRRGVGRWLPPLDH